ncbi:MAG: lysophospholipid acyltransferase family protein [Pseudomonadota bacterium]
MADVQENAHSEEYYNLYDKSELTYANSFPQWHKRFFIKAVEWMTARIFLYRRMKRFEGNRSVGHQFWKDVLDEMGIELLTPEVDYERIPKTGPVIIVSNHPHGLVDGLVMGCMLSKVRDDFQILTRALLVGVERVEPNLIPVAFPHEEDSVRQNVEARARAMRAVKEGGCVALFPAGTVSTSDTWFGEPKERAWATFTAKMILQSGATVVPVYFTGSNTRLFHIANRISDMLRQSLLLYEIKAAFNKKQTPVIGHAVDPKIIQSFSKDREGLMAYLRAETLKLKPTN